MPTRTHTVYWDEESLANLKAAYHDLVKEAEERIHHITDLDVIEEMYRRLNLLNGVIHLMTERAG